VIVLSLIARMILRLAGWQVVGDVPDVKKAVVAAAHHTSNWDGVLLVLGSLAVQRRILWLGKHTLFRFPLAPALRLLGGIPLDRTASNGAVEQAVAEFRRRETMYLALSPEGTRRKVSRWKRGFYQIALEAGVPIVLASPDYKRRQIVIGPVIWPSGDIDADMVRIREFFQDKTPRFPERAGDMVITGTRRRETADLSQ